MKKLLFLLLLIASTGILRAYDFQDNGICYNILTGPTHEVEVTYEYDFKSNEANYSGLTHADIPNSVSYDGITFYVTSIGNSAFRGCSDLTSITILNSVSNIGSFAFDGCSSLTSVSITINITKIGLGAFSNCSGLTSITVEAGNTVYDSRNNCNAIIETETNTLIAGCQNTTIPNSVSKISGYAFRGCSGLTSITIPNSVMNIGIFAFDGCSGLTSISIPHSVTRIGEFAFKGCCGLTSITCETITPPVLPRLTDLYVFCDVVKSIPLYVPANSIELYRKASQWKDFTNIQATQYDIVPPELVGGEEALSELFSKTFVLPDGFLMNAFDIQIDGRVAVDGSYRIINAKIRSNYTTLNSSNLTIEDLYTCFYTWYAKHKDAFIWQPGSIRNEPDSMFAQVELRYSPLFYAQTGDTLYMNGVQAHHDGAQGEEPGYIWLIYVRNRLNTPYYAIVRRDEQKLSLSYFDTITHQVFMVENYITHRPDTIYKNGYQNYLNSDKHIRFRQYFEKDSMRYAEELDSIGRVYAKYTVVYNDHNSYPQMLQKETYYPSGALQMRVRYTSLSDIVETFREDGSKAVYKPSPDAQKKLQKYFKTYFHVPHFTKAAQDNINYFKLKVELRIKIDESGQMHVIKRTNDNVNWSYNYKSGLIYEVVIHNIIENYYGPYYKMFINKLLKQTFECKPATIDKVAVPSIMTVTFEHKFAPN